MEREIMTRVFPLLLAAPVALLFSGLAHADSHTCEQVADDVINTDGLTDDWSGIGRTHIGGKANDASFALRCAYDDAHLYVAVEVRDDYLYRGKKPSSKKDDQVRVELRVSGKKSDRLIVYPGVGAMLAQVENATDQSAGRAGRLSWRASLANALAPNGILTYHCTPTSWPI